MAFFDMPLDQLRTYLPPRVEPADFDAFWRQTLDEAHQFPLDLRLEAVDVGLRTLDTFDVTFNGFNGQHIKGWLLLPQGRSDKLPCVVEFIGYGGGRGYCHIFERFLPRLRELGVSEDDIRTMTIDNPARAFARA